MKEIVYEHPHPIWLCGRQFRVQVSGEQRKDRTWAGFVELTDMKSGSRFQTEQETSQPSRDALVYWATGLEHVYIEGALIRAICTTVSADPARNDRKAIIGGRKRGKPESPGKSR
jgi:hypothetical protein